MEFPVKVNGSAVGAKAMPPNRVPAAKSLLGVVWVEPSKIRLSPGLGAVVSDQFAAVVQLASAPLPFQVSVVWAWLIAVPDSSAARDNLIMGRLFFIFCWIINSALQSIKITRPYGKMCKWLGEFQMTIAPRQIKYYYPFGWFLRSGKARAGLNGLKIKRNFSQQDVRLRRDEADGASSSPPVPGASAKIRAGPPRCGK